MVCDADFIPQAMSMVNSCKTLEAHNNHCVFLVRFPLQVDSKNVSFYDLSVTSFQPNQNHFGFQHALILRFFNPTCGIPSQGARDISMERPLQRSNSFHMVLPRPFCSEQKPKDVSKWRWFYVMSLLYAPINTVYIYIYYFDLFLSTKITLYVYKNLFCSSLLALGPDRLQFTWYR